MLNFAGSYAFAQQQVSEKEKKVSYSFINEYGLNAGVSFDADPFVEITGVFVNSICFNKKQDLIGIGVGFDLFYVVIVPAFPVFVNYRHYFTSITNLKPLINVALGTRINIWGEAGLYSTIAGGFRYKALSFTLGFSMKTFNDANYFGGAEVKVGYTF
jgi:hypothetical protein